ncbi:hypothetical protein HYQ43_17040 [Paracoccus pantotrophus]|uniref:Uncharacterized protein n=1 Tax=Paracoccus pantotrophus TaxID=82367 RepID=A0A7H9BWQ2_PARPN|nr:hypothetical protein [Paracoccus pantotrophus]QLH15840.1 hypothetical protein HYQ43_17040 [Paracoccus pantotrophus]
MASLPSVDNRISAGNMLVALGMIVSVAVAWGNLSGRSDNMAAELSAVRAMAAANEARIRALETATARQDERMVLILDSLRKIESRIERGAHP